MGSIDEVRITDLSGPALATFANGAQTLFFVADATGTFQTQIVSTGQLGIASRAARHYEGIPEEALGLAADGTPTVVDLGIRTHFVEARAIRTAQGIEELRSIGMADDALIVTFLKFAEGVVAGTGEELDLWIVAGDLLATIYLLPLAIGREIVNAGGQIVLGEADA